jgi:hypothetical protein
MADEAGFLELLVANERVGRWLDILMDPYQRSRCLLEIRGHTKAGSLLLAVASRRSAQPSCVCSKYFTIKHNASQPAGTNMPSQNCIRIYRREVPM